MQRGDEIEGWSAAVLHELLDQLGSMDGRLTGAEPGLDERGVLGNYQWRLEELA